MILQGLLLIDAHKLPSPGWLRISDGVITELGEGPAPESPTLGDPDSLICPGFCDAHIHLPQVDSIGYDIPDLLRWLDRVIYPAEARWSDVAHARAQIRTAHTRMLAAGTLSYAGYLTTHAHVLGTIEAARSLHDPRALVGRVLMNRNCPSDLVGEESGSLDTPDDAIRVSINPRFAISCTPELLAEAGRAAHDGGCFVQTHLAEQQAECERTRTLFPDAPSYTHVYDDFGLLGPRTLLAHCVHLGPEEWRLIAERDAVVVHCPTANAFLQSGTFDLAAARERGIRVALGSDVAAGPDIAMPRVARAMLDTAKIRIMHSDGSAIVPSPAEAWTCITRGNADAIDLPRAGRLEVGAEASLLVLRVPFDMDEYLIGRLLYTWRNDYIAHRIVRGQPC